MRRHPLKSHSEKLSDKVAAIVLAGGEGTRLFPLTSSRCKPAVSFGGTYRLIDIPISNALNARLRHIFVLSQYLANSLHQHISETYRLDPFQGGVIEVLSPEENNSEKVWYEGTADAVRKNLKYLLNHPIDYFVILSGDQLYNMDLHELVAFAKKTEADLTVATIPVGKEDAMRMGLMQVDDRQKIQDFYEKPTDPAILERFAYTDECLIDGEATSYLGSMGIYVFKREALESLLTEHDGVDFGKHLIPEQIKKGNTYAYFYHGYWEDIGTIRSFYEANLALTTQSLALDLYDETNPIYAHPQHLPSPVIENTTLKDSIVGQGSVIEASEITHSLIGLRSIIGEGTVIRDSILISHQFYAPPPKQTTLPQTFSIGKNCQIEKAIIDEHTHIGNNVQLINKKNLDTYDSDLVYIRDGIIVVPPGTTIPDNFTLM